MTQLDSEVRKELFYVTVSVAALSVVMELVFLVLGKWDLSVLTGNLAGGGASLLSFYLLCNVVISALTLKPEDASRKVRSAKSLRLLMVAAIVAPAVWLGANPFAAVIPLVFYRAGLALYAAREKKNAPAPAAQEGEEKLE